MSTVVITRKQEYANRMRPYYILLDDKKNGVVPYKRSTSFDVAPGRHSLKMKIDWTGSPKVEFEIAENETITFEVSGFKFANLIMPLGAATALVSIVLRTAFHFNTFIFVLPFSLVFVYYLTFGRNKYLQLHLKY